MKWRWLDFNINQSARVKLTERGCQVYREFYELYGIQDAWPETDDDGWYEAQLHDVMSIFGSEVLLGAPLVFETNIQLQVRDREAEQKAKEQTERQASEMDEALFG